MAMMIYETAALVGGYAIDDLGRFGQRVMNLMETGGAQIADAGDNAAEAMVLENHEGWCWRTISSHYAAISIRG